MNLIQWIKGTSQTNFNEQFIFRVTQRITAIVACLCLDYRIQDRRGRVPARAIEIQMTPTRRRRRLLTSAQATYAETRAKVAPGRQPQVITMTNVATYHISSTTGLFREGSLCSGSLQHWFYDAGVINFVVVTAMVLRQRRLGAFSLQNLWTKWRKSSSFKIVKKYASCML